MQFVRVYAAPALLALAVIARRAAGRRCGLGRKWQDGLYSAWLLAMSRFQWPGLG